MSDIDIEKTQKTFRGLGWTVVLLGLLSLLFLGDASDGLLTVTIVGIGLCVVTGVWLAISPSVPVGVAAGVSLAILGIIDLMLAVDSGGLALIAPLIDFGFAVRVFIGCSSYAKALTATVPSELQAIDQEHLMSKRINNYCANCNRIRENSKDGKCPDCGRILMPIE